APGPADPFLDRPHTLNAVEPSSSADTATISAALLAHGADEAGATGPHRGRHRRSRRHETAESDVGLSPNRSTDRPRLRYSHHQGCGAAHARRLVPTGTRL